MRITAPILALVLGVALPCTARADSKPAKSKAAPVADKDKDKAHPPPATKKKQAEAPRPPANPSACVKLAQDADDDKRTATFRLDSSCDRDLECTIAWELRCDGSPAASTEKPFTLKAGTVEKFEVSAEVCGEKGYVVGAPRWSCKERHFDTAEK